MLRYGGKPKPWPFNPARVDPRYHGILKNLIQGWFLWEGGGLPVDYAARRPADSLTKGSGGWSREYFGTCVEFDGSATTIDTGWAQSGMAQGTWLALVVHGSDPPFAEVRTIFRNTAITESGAIVARVNVGNDLQFYINDGAWQLATGPNSSFPKDIPTVVGGRWNQNGIPGESYDMDCWQDGVAGSTTDNIGATPPFGSATNNELWIGQRGPGSGSNQEYWYGHIGALLFFDRALSRNEMMFITSSVQNFMGMLRPAEPSVFVSIGPQTISLTGATTPAGAVLKRVGKKVAGSISSAGSILKRVGKGVAGTLSSVGSLANVKMATARPDEIVSQGSWLGSYTDIDELRRASGGGDASDFILSPGEGGDTIEIGLSALGDPGVDTDYHWEYQYHKQGTETINLVVELYAGATLVKQQTHNDISATVTLVELTLSGAEVTTFRANGGYGDARIKVTATKV